MSKAKNPGGKRGPAPKCHCGACRACRDRVRLRDRYRKMQVTDAELERRLVTKFATMGWD